MATLLDQYLGKQSELQSQIAANSLPLDAVVVLQELNYRICVLKTMQSFCQTAPITTDTLSMGFHYQMVDSYVHFLQTERKFGPKVDDAGIKKRETAAATMDRICNENRRRFASFKVTNQNQYKNGIGSMVNTILPAWIQYRNTFINI